MIVAVRCLIWLCQPAVTSVAVLREVCNTGALRRVERQAVILCTVAFF